MGREVRFRSIRRLCLSLLFVAGIALAATSFYQMFAHNLLWIVEKRGHEKGGPWLLGVIGLVAAAWSASELILSRQKTD